MDRRVSILGGLKGVEMVSGEEEINVQSAANACPDGAIVIEYQPSFTSPLERPGKVQERPVVVEAQIRQVR